MVLLAGEGTKFDLQAALAAATIIDTALERNLSDTFLGEGSGVLSGKYSVFQTISKLVSSTK